MEKLLIVDGSQLLFQSFFGMPNKIQNSRGEYIEAVICFTGILLKTIKALSPDKILVVFDGENKLARQSIDNNYKANRTDYSNVDDIDNPFAQLPYIKQVLDYLGIKSIETKDCEADDYIAGIVNNYKENYNIIISTSDKDFYQLIDKNVTIFTYRGKASKLWNVDEIITKYGFSSQYFDTYKALIGDKSDNISGIKGIGEKTASALIKQFGDLMQILNSKDILPEKIKNLLSNNIDKLLQNYKLVTLKNAKKDIDISSLSFSKIAETSTQILTELNIR